MAISIRSLGIKINVLQYLLIPQIAEHKKAAELAAQVMLLVSCLALSANEGAGWLHFDLAAAYNADDSSLWAAGATGLGIATIADLIAKH